MATTKELTTWADDDFGSNLSTPQPYSKPFDDSGIIASGIIIYIFLFVGILLNLVTILVIAKYPKLRNVFMYFLFSLCVSDLVSAVISPLFWYRRTLGFESFDWPEFFCKFYWASDIATSFATALHIMSFGLVRYVSLRCPFCFGRFSKKSALIWIVAIWTVSIGCGFVPFFIFFGAEKQDRLSQVPHARWPACTVNREWYSMYKLYQKVAYSVFIYIPMVAIVFLSGLIVCTASRARTRTAGIHSSSMHGKARRIRKEKQAATQLGFIVFSFLLGYIPFTAYEFWSVQDHPNTPYYRKYDWWFGMTEYLFIRLSECLNPLFYNLGSSKMRKFTKLYLAEKVKCLKMRKPIRKRAISLTGVV